MCPTGCEHAAVRDALRHARGGIRPLTRYRVSEDKVHCAGETDIAAVQRWLSVVECVDLDWNLQMAVAAARQAWRSSGLAPNTYRSERIAVSAGGSGAGLNYSSASDLFSLRLQPQEQATAVANAINAGGPVVMFSSASAGSGLALAHAMNLLRLGRCDVVVAGGAEALSAVNHAAMDAMRLCGDEPCSPFSGQPGLTPGEGSAYFVLERLGDCLARGAACLAELYSFGATHDGYDVVAADPSGEGLGRAFAAAFKMSALLPHQVDWIKANGTSNREQDIAETLAIRQIFEQPPPVFAAESFVGHANGAAPAITLALSVIAFQDQVLPPTLQFSMPRAGCDLDYVPNLPRRSEASAILASTLGFGGSNVAFLLGKPGFAPLHPITDSTLCITGIGVVSPFGVGRAAFLQALRENRSAIRNVERLRLNGKPHCAAVVGDSTDVRFSNKLSLLQRYSLIASAEAMADAALLPGSFDPARIGIFAGLTRGSAEARTQFANAIGDSSSRQNIGRLVVRMGRFTVASAISQHFQLQGCAATISEGFGAGLHTLAHACTHLQISIAEDAMVVVASDEIGPGTAASLAQCNWLAQGHDGCFLQPYNSASAGTILAEGAVALVLERADAAKRRGAEIQARIYGSALRTGPGALAAAIQEAAAGVHISATHGNGSGIWQHDEAEWRALPLQIPLACVNAGLGFAEASSGLFQVAAAIHSLRTGELFSLSGPRQHSSLPTQLITASTERDRHAAVVLSA